MFVPCPLCIAIPYPLCIWIFPPLASWFCFSRLYTPFLSALYSVFVGPILCFCLLIYSVSVASFTRFPYSSTHFLVWKCPFCPASRKVSSILRSSTFPTSFPLSIPRQSLRAIFFVSCHTYSTVPFHPASSPVLPCHASSLTVFSYPSLSSLACWKPNKQRGWPLFMWKEVSLSVCFLKSHTRRHCQYFSSALWLYPWAVGQP